MLHIPILRHGRPYESVETIDIIHHATGEPLARVSLANSGLIARDIRRMNPNALESFTMADLIDATKRAGDIFLHGTLPLGGIRQSFDDYIRDLSATTGMPIACCRNNANKIHRVFSEIDSILAGLTRDFDLSTLDKGYGCHAGRMLSFARTARVFGAVLPSNSPGVHSLWIPAVTLKTPIAIKPGREEPWSPWRIIQSFIAAGLPPEAFGYYPTDHAGGAEILRNTDRSMLFGGDATTRPYAGDPRVELHGPGYSKIILGQDAADDWERHLDIMVSSILANGGRSCINASGIWIPRNARPIAEAVAEKLAAVRALPPDDPEARIAAFANTQMAETISRSIDQLLETPGAVDLTARLRGAPRLTRAPLRQAGQETGNVSPSYLLPTVIHCEDPQHPLAHKEYLFPYAAVVECPLAELPDAIGSTLIATAITRDESLIGALMAAPHVDRLNIGPIPTTQISWDQPHEGNLFEHLYRRRALQIEPAA